MTAQVHTTRRSLLALSVAAGLFGPSAYAQAPAFNAERVQALEAQAAAVHEPRTKLPEGADLHAETRRLLASNADDKFEQAVKLAASYQLVTPATGAVVLETKEQYERAGLQPVPQNSVPTIPEPEEWLLMIVAASVLLWVTLRRRFRWQSV